MHALVLTDAVDSTSLSEALSPKELAGLWAEHDRIARDLLVAHGGREIDKSDGFLLLFETVQGAVNWALAYHRASPLPARAGVHWGALTLRENTPKDVARGAKMLEVEGLAKPIAARIMSLAMGGQTLLSKAAVAELDSLALTVETVSHGFWQLKGVSEPMELFEVGEDQAPFQPPPDSRKVWRVVQGSRGWLPLREVPRTLPPERESFVGRQRDLRALAQHMDQGARLVSLLGTGGTGKTRLALRYSWQWLGAWSGGAAFCDLSEARSVEGIAKAVALALELPLRDAEPVQQVGQVLSERGPTLVVLDNFEQVARFASDTLGQWLDQAPRVQFLVTTREVLGIPGEQILALPPLSQDDGVALFTERARRVMGRDFESGQTQDIAAVVELVDRLPLAIELAAARCRSMSPRSIRERMDQRFRLLASTGGRRDRQATLRATLDWSWELLDAEEQTALAQLSVFEGAFDLSAVEAVIHTEQDSWPADLIQALVDKSLVRSLEQDRFGLLISVHDYAREKLVSESQATLRHLRHYARWGAPSAIEALHGPEGIERWQAMLRSLDNLIAACRRAVAMNTPALAAQTLLATTQVLLTVGPFSLGEELARPVLAMSHPRAIRIQLELELAKLLGLMGRSDEQLAMLELCLSQARLHGDPLLELQTLNAMAGPLSVLGRLEDAEGILRTCLADPVSQQDAHLLGSTHNTLGMLTGNMGRAQEARTHFSAAVALHRKSGNRAAEARSLGNLGSNAATQAENLVHLSASLALHESLGNRRSKAIVLGNLGRVCRRLGRIEEAYAHSRNALRLHRELGNRRSIGIQLLTLGSLDRVHRVPGARALLEEALMTQREVGFRRGQSYCCAELAMLDLGQGELQSADRWAVQARQLSQGYSGARVWADAASALILCAQDRPEQALALIQQTPMTEKTKPIALSVWAWSAALSGDRVQAEQCLAALEQLPEALVEEPRDLREQTLSLLERGL